MTGKALKLEPHEITPVALGHGDCVATDRIVVDGEKVGYMYREAPTGAGDSGWRFSAGNETGVYMANDENCGVYDVNTLVNYDPDILPFLDAACGSRFERDEAGELRQIRGVECNVANSSYWSPLIELRNQLRCWVRVAWRAGHSTGESGWDQLLIAPMPDCLETGGGPIELRMVEWVEVSTRNVTFHGGTPARPPQFVDIRDELLAGLQRTQLRWELRETRWSIERVFGSMDKGFKDEPVQLVRILNPFGPTLVGSFDHYSRADPA